MRTPIFPDRLDSDEQDGDFETTTDASISNRSELMAFSDLSRPARAEFRARWLAMTGAGRERLLRSLVEFAELSVDVNYWRIYREVLGDEYPRIRQLAIEGLWENDESDLPAIYLGILQSDPDDDVRSEAAAALQRHLDELLSTTDAEDHALLIETLVTTGGDSNENALVRRRCIEASGAFAGNERVSSLIREAYADDDQTLAAGALRAMGLSRQSRWIPEIERAMESQDAELRFEAAGSAGLLGVPDLIESLTKLLDDEDPEVQAAAVGAIGKIGGTGALRVLRRWLETQVIDDEDMIQDALDEAMLSDDPLARA